MAREHYRSFNFRDKSLDLIATMNKIIGEYLQAGFTLTVRQLYYQLVARDIIPNTERSYQNTTSLVNDARLAGMIDWDAIEDRTREFIRRARWDSGKAILDACAKQFHMDMWKTQPGRVFCIIEKEALVGVLQRVCNEYDVPLLAARGYPSVSVLREFAIEDILPVCGEQDITVLHLGDHDPSGIDMTRDLRDRIELFCRGPRVQLVRIALTMDQIQERNPPPNPAKTTDSRFEQYMNEYGTESWELDALPPEYLEALVQTEIEARIADPDEWEASKRRIKKIRDRILEVAKTFA